MRLHRRVAAAVPVLAAAALLAPLAASAAPAASVSIADQSADSACGYTYCFDPGTVHVDPGGTVTWTSHSEAPHTVTADDGSWGSGSPDLTVGQSFSHTFPTSGTFTYHCNVHSYMTGTVVVGSGSPPTSQPAPPKPPTAPPATPKPATPPPAVHPAATAAATPAASPPTAAATSAAPVAAASTPDSGQGAGAGSAASPTPSSPATAPVAVPSSSGGGGGAGPVLAVVAAFVAAGAAGTWLVRRRRASFTKIH